MPKLPRNADEVQVARSIIDELIEETEKPNFGDEKTEHIRAVRHQSGVKGGSSRAKILSPERRREIAQKAAASRWKGKKP